MSKKTNPVDGAVEFFREHAGWGYKPGEETPEEGRVRGAVQLALAEEWFKQQGGKVKWVIDEYADRSWMDGEPGTEDADDGRPLFGCVVSIPCPTCGGKGEQRSLWSIDLGPTGTECPEYKRVVEAELALDLMG